MFQVSLLNIFPFNEQKKGRYQIFKYLFAQAYCIATDCNHSIFIDVLPSSDIIYLRVLFVPRHEWVMVGGPTLGLVKIVSEFATDV